MTNAGLKISKHDIYRERSVSTRLSTVKKPVEAIQCSNTFSLLQRKMYNVLLANAAGSLYSATSHRISISIMCNLMGYRSKDYKTIKERFRELRRMDIEWDIINEDGNKVWTNTSPLSLARVIEGEGVCEYEFTPGLIPFLDSPAQYAKFSLAIQAKFKSSYGLALYENCERYKRIGFTKTFDILTFRKLMGVGPTEYEDFFALKRRVLDKAVKEVNEYADFDIKPELEKRGRNIVAIRFLIEKKSQALILIDQATSSEVTDDRLMHNLKAFFGLKEKEINTYLQTYGREYVEGKVSSILESNNFKSGGIKNMAGYLKAALSQDYQKNVSSKEIVAKQKDVVKANLESHKRNVEDYELFLTKEICQLVKNGSEEFISVILEQFKSHVGEFSMYWTMFRERGIAALDNSVVAREFMIFVTHRRPDISSTILSLKDYLDNHK